MGVCFIKIYRVQDAEVVYQASNQVGHGVNLLDFSIPLKAGSYIIRIDYPGGIFSVVKFIVI